MSQIENTLAERGSRYGKFSDHARITQEIKQVMQETPQWPLMTPSQREALEMVAHKIGRIVNGDPTYIDSWVDIEGYVHLVVLELQETEKRQELFRKDREAPSFLRARAQDDQTEFGLCNLERANNPTK